MLWSTWQQIATSEACASSYDLRENAHSTIDKMVHSVSCLLATGSKRHVLCARQLTQWLSFMENKKIVCAAPHRNGSKIWVQIAPNIYLFILGKRHKAQNRKGCKSVLLSDTLVVALGW